VKSGFVNIFGKPNAGKSTLLNALIKEKLAIVSSKVQTTRHRIKGILTTEEYQIIFSDTPGILEPKYKLHEKMMLAVKSALEDADLALLLVDVSGDWAEADTIFSSLRLKVPSILLLNKIDAVKGEKLQEAVTFFGGKAYAKDVMPVSALDGRGVDALLQKIVAMLPRANLSMPKMKCRTCQPVFLWQRS
jgi:GTP-binding protein Era